MFPTWLDRRRPGFSLLELLVVLVLMAVFATVANPVLQWSMRTLVTPPAAVAAARLDAAVGALRRDVWRAVSMTAPSPHELVVTDSNGRLTTWQLGPGDRLRRDGRQWAGGFPDAMVVVDGATVRLTLPDRRGFRGGIVTLSSQAMSIGRGS